MAFLQANTARAVRGALLARTRALRRRYEVGEWCYYWREGESVLELRVLRLGAGGLLSHLDAVQLDVDQAL